MKPLRTVLASLALVGLLMGGEIVHAQPPSLPLKLFVRLNSRPVGGC